MRYFALLLLLILLAACTATEPTPQFDISQVNSITEPIDSAIIAEVAQLADAETLAQGEEIYNTYCASCHGAEGEGQFPDNPMQPDETGRIGAPPHTSAGHTWHHADQLLYDIVKNGSDAPPNMFYPMPAFGEQLSDDEIVAVISFLKTWWTEDERRVQAQRTLLAAQQG